MLVRSCLLFALLGYVASFEPPTTLSPMTSPTVTPPAAACSVLVVADLLTAGASWHVEHTLVRATVAGIFDGAKHRSFPTQVAFWRYSSGPDADGPLPTAFGTDYYSVPIRFEDKGGDLSVANATASINNWSVTNSVIAIFTSSNKNQIVAAGQNYLRKALTVGISDTQDASPFAAVVLHEHDTNMISDAILDMCKTVIQQK
ncbi:unnamed protein product, partial [Mesorhabditis spiculigera]